KLLAGTPNRPRRFVLTRITRSRRAALRGATTNQRPTRNSRCFVSRFRANPFSQLLKTPFTGGTHRHTRILAGNFWRGPYLEAPQLCHAYSSHSLQELKGHDPSLPDETTSK